MPKSLRGEHYSGFNFESNSGHGYIWICGLPKADHFSSHEGGSFSWLKTWREQREERTLVYDIVGHYPLLLSLHCFKKFILVCLRERKWAKDLPSSGLFPKCQWQLGLGQASQELGSSWLSRTQWLQASPTAPQVCWQEPGVKDRVGTWAWML